MVYQFIPRILVIRILTWLLKVGPIIYFWFIFVTTLRLLLCILSCSQMLNIYIFELISEHGNGGKNNMAEVLALGVRQALLVGRER